jgi:DNA helicase-2/ATP-dependent DNA helicase PcrA
LSATAPKRAAAAWGEFIEAMTQIGERAAAQAPPDQLVQLVLDAGYADYLARTYDNAAARLEDLHQLAHFARQFAQLEDCLAQLALLSNLEAEGDGPPADPGDRLRLTTVHQAKGLEFEVVFVIMLCDGMFPSQYAAEHPAGEEEERRLFYVAVTRAKEELYLTYPLTRTSRTTHEPTPQKASRFLTDLPPDAFEEWNLLPYGASAGGW